MKAKALYIMNKILCFLAVCILFVSCKETSEDDRGIQADSSGNINSLSVVVESELWNGEVGDAIRKHLASPVHGLPQDEPIFSINQMPPESFEGFVRRNRIFLYVEKGRAAAVNVADDSFARPQKGVFIYGQTNEEIIAQLEEKAAQIVEALKKTELKERQRRIGLSLIDDTRLKEAIGVSLKIPSAYRYAKQEEDFFWIRRDIASGSMEILIYEVPLRTFEKDTNIIGSIIKMRDSIGEKHIPGRLEGSYMITETAYAPYLFESQIDGKFAYESRGMWEVNSDFMGGPFVNYAVRDEANDRYVILEGFMFRPSAAKRDYMFELEAIIQSAKIQ